MQSHYQKEGTHTYVHTYIHTHKHTHIHTYIHTYIHTCIHTYIHTCILSFDKNHECTSYLYKYVYINFCFISVTSISCLHMISRGIANWHSMRPNPWAFQEVKIIACISSLFMIVHKMKTDIK